MASSRQMYFQKKQTLNFDNMRSAASLALEKADHSDFWHRLEVLNKKIKQYQHLLGPEDSPALDSLEYK